MKEWFWKDAEWWEFWQPMSGLPGGLIGGAIFGGVLIAITEALR